MQPVIPISLSKDWNLITRTIIPIIDQPSPAPGVRSAFGLGDINPHVDLSPAKPGKLIWGIGPTLTFPTATNSKLGAANGAQVQRLSLTIQGHWVWARWLTSNGPLPAGEQNVSAFLVQPFINYNLPDGWY